MGDLVEHGLGDPLFVEQVIVVPGDLVALLNDGSLQTPQPIHRLDLGGQDHLVIGFCQEIVATGLQATSQGLAFGQ